MKTRNFAQLNSSLDDINNQMIAVQLANFADATFKPVGSTKKVDPFTGLMPPEEPANTRDVAVNSIEGVNKATAEVPAPEVTSNTVVNAVPKTQETPTPPAQATDNGGATVTENDPGFWKNLYNNLAGLVQTMGEHLPATIGIGAGVAGLTVGTVMLVKALKKKKLSNAKIKEAIINAGGTEEVADKLNEVSA